MHLYQPLTLAEGILKACGYNPISIHNRIQAQKGKGDVGNHKWFY